MRRISMIGGLIAPLLALGIAPAAAGGLDVPPQAATIDPALAIHLSARGLEAIGDSIAGIVPAGITIGGISGNAVCDAETGDNIDYDVESIEVRLQAGDVSITPSDGRLDVHIELTLWSEPADATVVGTCFLELDELCTITLQPTAIGVDLGLTLALTDGALEIGVDTIELTHGNFGNPAETGCVLGDAIAVLEGYGIDLIGDILDSLIEEQLATLQETLETTLGDFSQLLAFEGELPILNAVLTYSLVASEIQISETGVTIGFTSKFDTPAYGPCVPQVGAYVPDAGPMPALSGLIPDTDVPYHMAILASEDLVNQALFAAWQGGVLCLNVKDLVDFDITTGYLELAEPDLVGELWPEQKPLDLRISADLPPLAEFSGGPRITAEMNLDVFGEELGRQTRYWGNGLFADAGIGLDLVEGTLLIDLDFDLQSSLGVTVSYNEWLPSAIPESFGALIPNLVGQVLDPATLLPSFPIPAIFGITLADLDMRVVGSGEDYLGVYLWVDPSLVEPIELSDINLNLPSGGCGDGGGGCGDSGDIIACEDGSGCEDTGGGCGGDSGCGGDGGGCGGDGGGCGGGGAGCAQASVRGMKPRHGAMILVPLLLITRRRR